MAFCVLYRESRVESGVESGEKSPPRFAGSEICGSQGGLLGTSPGFLLCGHGSC